MHQFLVLGVALAVVACATSPTGRTQFKAFPASQMDAMGVAAYDQMKADTPISKDAKTNAYVRCVAMAIADQVTGPAGSQAWEVTVFDDPMANAFALPGGKMGVYTGLLKVAKNQDQLAAVLGHEVGHVIAEHGNERVTTQAAAQAGLQVVDVISGAASPGKQQLMGALGLGAQYGVILPFGRAQESEADVIGLDLMAKAGFDPRQSVELWKNMAALGGQQPPEFLSTHPANQTRIQNLQQRMPQAIALEEKARARGKSPDCS